MRTTTAILPESFHPANPHNVGAARPADYQHQQLTFGPSEAVKSKPTIARLRDAMDAFNIRGTCRLVAYELLTYWQPGGDVFPSVRDHWPMVLASPQADGATTTWRDLERSGLWVRMRHASDGDDEHSTRCSYPDGLAVARGGGAM